MQYTPNNSPIPKDQLGLKSALTKRWKVVLIGVLAIVTFLYFSISVLQTSTSFYLTVDELVERETLPAQSIQVKGKLVEGTFARNIHENTLATFILEENGAQIKAIYDGVLPDLFFNPHSEIVLGGTYNPEIGFSVNRVLVKCPSKYQSLENEQPYEDVAAA
ncbi:MAG: hypothetical protein CL763_00190 [Chloroflexi bacterium]|nr:hypothetical protein [Chloroflexota bacterium]|tara:strand:- start:590 stop:1075 length:486 start_codon:yes stop_codon:yes gene_type:complete